MSISISVITPSFNQGRFIERTIQSVLTQSISGLEYVVVDGNSQDETVSILKKFSKKLNFISESDRGQTDAVNKGLRMTSGDIIGWLNSDDIYYPDTLKKVHDFFQSHPEIDVIYGDAHHIDQEDRIIEPYPTEPWNLDRLKQTCYLSQPAVFFRRRVIDKHGLLDEGLHFCMDYEYWLRLGLNNVRFHYLKQVLAGSRLYPETKTQSSPLKVREEILSMLKYHLGKIPETWLINYAISYVKIKTHLHYPQLRFILMTGILMVYTFWRWNGLRSSMISFSKLPKIMSNRYQRRRHR